MPPRDGVSPARGDLTLVVVLAATPLVIETLAGYVRAGFDLGWFFLPLWEWWFAHPRFLGGWNPWLFAGFPAGSDPQLAVLHPFTFLHAALPGLVATAVEGALVPAVAAAGMLLYLRRIRCGRAGAIAGALSFALGGYLTAHAPHPGIERAAMMVPWGLLAIEALAGRALVAGLGLVVGAILLGGHPQVSVLAVALLLLDAIWLGRVTERGRAAALFAGFALGATVGAAVWLPTVQLVPTTTRALGGPIFPDPTFTVADLPRLFVPLLHGGGIGPLATPRAGAITCGPVECSAYPGMLVWIALLAGLLPVLRTPHGRFWLAVAAFALIGATGVLPLPTGVRGAARVLLWWNAGFAIAGALAIGHVAAREVSRRALGLAWLALAVLVAALAVAHGGAGAQIGAWLALALGGLALLALHRDRHERSALRWLGAALALDLLVFAATLAPAAVRPGELARVRAPVRSVRAVLDDPACGVAPEARVLFLTPFEGLDWAPAAAVASVQGYDPLVPQGVARLLGQTGAGLEAVGFVGDATLASDSNRALDVLRVGLVVRDGAHPSVLGDAIAAAAARGDARWQVAPCVAPDGLALFLNRRTLPLAWLAGTAQAAVRHDAIARVRGADGGFDPRSVVLLDIEPERALAAADGTADGAHATRVVPGQADAGVARGTGVVEVVARGDDHLELRATVERSAWLVTSEVAAAGWTATVDGAPVAIVTANGAFRALPLGAGAHVVRFVYRPLLAWLGLALSVLGVLTCVVVGGGRVTRAQSQGPSWRSNASTGDSPA